MAERAHWGKFTKLKEGSEHLLADVGRKLHGLWHLRDGQARGVSVANEDGEKRISLDLTWAEVFHAPDDVRTTLSRLGLGPENAIRISLGLKKAYKRSIRDMAYGFSVEIHPIVEAQKNFLRKGIHAMTGFAHGREEWLLRLHKRTDLVNTFTNISPRIDESDELRRLLVPVADYFVHVVKSRAAKVVSKVASIK